MGHVWAMYEPTNLNPIVFWTPNKVC